MLTLTLKTGFSSWINNVSLTTWVLLTTLIVAVPTNFDITGISFIYLFIYLFLLINDVELYSGVPNHNKPG